MISRVAEAIFLFIGDVVLFYASLFFTLFIRYEAGLKWQLVSLHLAPFSLLFLFSVIVFFIAGLYERHTLFFQKRLPVLLVKTLVVNSILAVLLFYFIPSFLITPRANLFIYLFVSFTLIFLWRWYGGGVVGTGDRERGMILGNGEEFQELLREVNENPRYNLLFVLALSPERLTPADSERLAERAGEERITLMVVDSRQAALLPVLPRLYTLLFSRVRFIELGEFYEEIFGRVLLSRVKYEWFLEHASVGTRRAYDLIKRAMDIILALPLSLIPLVLSPLVYAVVWLEDRGGLWSVQKRVGQNGREIKILKFRTMRIANDNGAWETCVKNEVTKVGAFLRFTRLDEFPALWNVLKGDLSLIGPRPEFAQAVAHYIKEVSFYDARHLIKPGLSGLAQLYGEHPHHGTDVVKTKNKLSYDLYYLKNRSFFLDLKIALKTIKALLSRSGV